MRAQLELRTRQRVASVEQRFESVEGRSNFALIFFWEADCSLWTVWTDCTESAFRTELDKTAISGGVHFGQNEQIGQFGIRCEMGAVCQVISAFLPGVSDLFPLLAPDF